jgi:hypothetical protein
MSNKPKKPCIHRKLVWVFQVQPDAKKMSLFKRKDMSYNTENVKP